MAYTRGVMEIITPRRVCRFVYDQYWGPPKVGSLKRVNQGALLSTTLFNVSLSGVYKEVMEIITPPRICRFVLDSGLHYVWIYLYLIETLTHAHKLHLTSLNSGYATGLTEYVTMKINKEKLRICRYHSGNCKNQDNQK